LTAANFLFSVWCGREDLNLEIATPTGYAALIDAFHLRVPSPRLLSLQPFRFFLT
jgi:hypothetical protein